MIKFNVKLFSHETILMRINKKNGQCSRCNKPRNAGGRYCKACHAEYMRDWRARRKDETVVVSREYLHNLEQAVQGGHITKEEAYGTEEKASPQK